MATELRTSWVQVTGVPSCIIVDITQAVFKWGGRVAGIPARAVRPPGRTCLGPWELEASD